MEIKAWASTSSRNPEGEPDARQGDLQPRAPKGASEGPHADRPLLQLPGKHIFIYGDRGVGKTSLAQTAAFLQQSADSSPIL